LPPAAPKGQLLEATGMSPGGQTDVGWLVPAAWAAAALLPWREA